MSEKLAGYSFLLVGLGIMVFCVVNVFMVFTNKAKPFSVFNLTSTNSGINVQDLVGQMQKNNPSLQNQSLELPKLDILPPEVLNQTLNMTTHFFLMSFLLGFGYKLASLGVQLVRPISVKLKSNMLEVIKSFKDQENTSTNLETMPQPASPPTQAAQS